MGDYVNPGQSANPADSDPTRSGDPASGTSAGAATSDVPASGVPRPEAIDRGPLSPLPALLPGAVLADSQDECVAAHYGDPHGEQRALINGPAFVDLSHRGVLRIGGADRLSLLHSLTTQHLSALTPGVSAETLLLDPQGRIEHAIYLIDDGEATWAHVEPAAAPALVAFLTKMRFMLDVDPRDVTDEYAIVLEVGSHTPDVLARDSAELAEVVGGREIFLPRARLAEFAGSHRPWAGMWAYEALRIAAHRPRHGLETDSRTIPHELGWVGGAVHLNKGCYRGQETVARVENLGHPPRRLVFLHLDGTPERLPVHGAPVEADGRAVGQVTSSARHYELGPIALALIKRTVPVEAELLADGIPATQEVVVSPTAGGTARERLRAR